MSNDRVWLEQKYLSQITGDILYVGTNTYTSHYPTLIGEGTFESLDSCPERSRLGGSTSAAHHNVSILDFFPTKLYDHVSIHGCHGYMGHNIDNSCIQEELIHASSWVKPGGTFQFGPGCGYLSQYNEPFWTQFTKGLPFTEYEILHNKVETPNYIFWGRKLEK